MSYPDGTVPTDDRVQPTPVYETLAMGLVAWGLWSLRDRLAPGLLFALYLVLSGLERFLVEFVRRNDEVWVGTDGAPDREPGPDAGRPRLVRAREPPPAGLRLRPV